MKYLLTFVVDERTMKEASPEEMRPHRDAREGGRLTSPMT